MSASNLSSRGQRARERAERARELALASSDDNDEETHNHPVQSDQEEQQNDEQSREEEEEEDSQGVNEEEEENSQGISQEEEEDDEQTNETTGRGGRVRFRLPRDSGSGSGCRRKHKSGQMVITAEVLQALLNNHQQQKEQQQQPVINVHSVAAEKMELGSPYDGGLDLEMFEQDFRAVMQENRWNDKVASIKLRQNLTGTAAKVIYNYVRDEGRRNIGVDEIFAVLSASFDTPDARMDAKARYESIHQRKGERILDYVARFQKARIESGHRDGPNAAMKFFRNLTIDVDHMPWKAEYTTVDAVANAVAGLDLTAKIRAKRKRREEEEEEEEKSEDEKQKFTSRLARLEQDKLAKKRALKKGESLDEGDGDPTAKEPGSVSFSDVKALIQTLAVQWPNSNSQQGGNGGSRSSSNSRGGRSDLPMVVHNAQTEREEPAQVVCQLCALPGHHALDCRNMICKQCHRVGHSEKYCNTTIECGKCGKTNHKTVHCEQDVMCHRCGRRGHSERRCRAPQDASAGQVR